MFTGRSFGRCWLDTRPIANRPQDTVPPHKAAPQNKAKMTLGEFGLDAGHFRLRVGGAGNLAADYQISRSVVHRLSRSLNSLLIACVRAFGTHAGSYNDGLRSGDVAHSFHF